MPILASTLINWPSSVRAGSRQAALHRTSVARHLFHPLLKFGPRRGLRSDHERAVKAIDQQFRPAGNERQNSRNLRDRGNALFTGQQRRVRSLPQGFDDHRHHIRLGQQHDIRWQQPLDDQNAVLWNGLKSRVLITTKPPDDISPQVQHIVGALAKGWILQRLEFLIPPL